MKTSLPIMVSIAFCSNAMLSCSKDEPEIVLYFEKAVPDCIESRIRKEIKKEFNCLPAQIWEWKVNGKTFYYFEPKCADGFNELFDDNCNAVCAPSGGLAGNGYGTCPDFVGPIEETLVWDNPNYP